MQELGLKIVMQIFVAGIEQAIWLRVCANEIGNQGPLRVGLWDAGSIATVVSTPIFNETIILSSNTSSQPSHPTSVIHSIHPHSSSLPIQKPLLIGPFSQLPLRLHNLLHFILQNLQLVLCLPERRIMKLYRFMIDQFESVDDLLVRGLREHVDELAEELLLIRTGGHGMGCGRSHVDFGFAYVSLVLSLRKR